MSKLKILAVIACALTVFLLSNFAVAASSTSEVNRGTARQMSAITGRLSQALEQNARIERTLTEQSATIAALQSEQTRITQQLEADHQRLEGDQRRLTAMIDDNQATSVRNDIATILNIVGMIFGVVGGVLLAGSQLSARQERITDLRVTRSLMDLGLRETRKEPILNFFGLLGSIAIAIGFVLQFIGALVAAPLPWLVLTVLGAGALTFVAWLILFFLRYTPNQTPTAKAAVVMYNLRRHILQPMWRAIFRRQAVTCQVCLQDLTLADTQVWWLYEENTENFRYLHQPYDFHYGHEECLPQTPAFGVYFDVPGKYDRLHLSKASAKAFLEQEIPKLRNWYVDFHRHWTEVRKSPSEETAWEEQLNHVEKDISRLMF